MPRSQSIAALVLLMSVSGCASGRIVQLERDVEELKESLAQAERQRAQMQREIEALRRGEAGTSDTMASAESEGSSEPIGFLGEDSGSIAAGEVESSELEMPSQPEGTFGAAFQPPEPTRAEDPGIPEPEEILEMGSSSAASEAEDVSMLSSADDLYAEAFANFQKAGYHKAILQFNVFVERYPNHDLTDNAFYWMGECWYGLRNYPRAIATFETVLERFPKGNKAPDSLLKKAYALQKTGKAREALAAFQELIRRFPQSPSAAKAQAKVKELQEAQS